MKVNAATDSIWNTRIAEQIFFPDESDEGSLPCERCYLGTGKIVRSDNPVHDPASPVYSGHESEVMRPVGRMM